MIRQLWDLLPSRTHKVIVGAVTAFVVASTAALWGGLAAWLVAKLL